MADQRRPGRGRVARALLARCGNVFWGQARTGLVALAAMGAALCAAPEAKAQIGGSRYAAIVVDASTGREILAINADEPRYPASLTKMMTLYLAFEAMQQGRLSPTTRIPVSRHAAGQQPSKLGLRAGSTITVRDAVLALITKSANDAAAALGERLGGSEVQFGRVMTRKARELGMRSTSFRNASGLPDAQQVTTARDMAILSRALHRDFPGRYDWFSIRSFNYNGQTIHGHNRVLTEYDGADGLKTGYINASGFNIATSAERDGRRIVAVVFGGATSRERDDHVMALLDRGFSAGPGRNSDMMTASVSPRLIATANAAPMAAPALSPPPMARPVASRTARPVSARGNWGVQVGAFTDRQIATRAASSAAKSLGAARVERVKVKGVWYYRAQVMGLSAGAARNLCDARRGPCMVLQP
ncbi:serine hydrolase [Pseudoroseomonas globiformis]|uniref:Serine hydrolase n=1 Tax=Teichococcus globiformis TaxID=2307229 RepID=A0ABV7G4V2_9PROT